MRGNDVKFVKENIASTINMNTNNNFFSFTELSKKSIHARMKFFSPEFDLLNLVSKAYARQQMNFNTFFACQLLTRCCCAI